MIIFGSCISSFNSEWRNQGFTFCPLDHLKYGIVQHKVLEYYLVVIIMSPTLNNAYKFHCFVSRVVLVVSWPQFRLSF